MEYASKSGPKWMEETKQTGTEKKELDREELETPLSKIMNVNWGNHI
jgi:hypothetical protein